MAWDDVPQPAPDIYADGSIFLCFFPEILSKFLNTKVDFSLHILINAKIWRTQRKSKVSLFFIIFCSRGHIQESNEQNQEEYIYTTLMTWWGRPAMRVRETGRSNGLALRSRKCREEWHLAEGKRKAKKCHLRWRVKGKGLKEVDRRRVGEVKGRRKE